MSRHRHAVLLLPLLAVLGACGQTGALVLPERSSPKQGYLLVDKPQPGTPAPPAGPDSRKPPAKATPVPSPSAPFPPQPVEPRSPLSTTTP